MEKKIMNRVPVEREIKFLRQIISYSKFAYLLGVCSFVVLATIHHSPIFLSKFLLFASGLLFLIGTILAVVPILTYIYDEKINREQLVCIIPNIAFFAIVGKMNMVAGAVVAIKSLV
ncbi:MAG: hypothetical protein N4A47_02000 [Clostridia bacterium]|jgi:hypothetical protein|nr:hypothetical protein [Clostridia bacterium]